MDSLGGWCKARFVGIQIRLFIIQSWLDLIRFVCLSLHRVANSIHRTVILIFGISVALNPSRVNVLALDTYLDLYDGRNTYLLNSNKLPTTYPFSYQPILTLQYYLQFYLVCRGRDRSGSWRSWGAALTTTCAWQSVSLSSLAFLLYSVGSLFVHLDSRLAWFLVKFWHIFVITIIRFQLAIHIHYILLCLSVCNSVASETKPS